MTTVAERPKLIVNPDDMRRQLRLMFHDGDVVEVRALQVQRPGRFGSQVESGFFDNMQDAEKAVKELSPHAAAVYITLNPVHPDLLARRSNRTGVADTGQATGDGQIITRRHILVDVDPERLPGISSTNAEHASALALATEIREAMFRHGWPEPIFGDSGNGAHLIWRIDDLADDGGLVRRCLESLAAYFNTKDLKVDVSVFNPARITKVFGTPVRKGDHILNRPHRLSRLIEAPEKLEPVGHELLVALAARAPIEPKPERRNGASPTGGILDVPRFLADAGVGIRSEIPAGDGVRYRLQRCPKCSSTTGNAWVLDFSKTGRFR